MLKLWHILLISIVLFAQISNQTAVQLPVPQKVMTKVTLSIQRLQALLKYFNTLFENRVAIYQRVQLTKIYLQELSASLAQYNNVIAGSGNAVNGTKNLVIGNYNNVQGNNNWVFVSKYTGKINGNLLIGSWRIELQKSNLILMNSRFAISYLNQVKNDYLRNKYTKVNRQMCAWDKWANPTNPKSDAHWNKYVGYNVWKVNILEDLGMVLTNTLTGVGNLVGTTVGGLFGVLGLRI